MNLHAIRAIYLHEMARTRRSLLQSVVAPVLSTALYFIVFGSVIGIWADSFEKLQMVPLLIVTPLTFLGGSFYSIDILPSFWRHLTLINPVVYLISGFRWSFYSIADVNLALSLGMTLLFLG